MFTPSQMTLVCARRAPCENVPTARAGVTGRLRATFYAERVGGAPRTRQDFGPTRLQRFSTHVRVTTTQSWGAVPWVAMADTQRGHGGRAAPTRATARRATIQDVAKAAGVSVSAVSKVLRGAYGVSPQMRDRVTATIDQLGYRPHTGARAMRGRSFTIGVMLVDFTSPFQPEVAQGISAHFHDTSYQDIVIAAGGSVTRQQGAVEALIDRQVDGLILIAPFTSQNWLEELGAKIPTVVIARHGGASNFDTIVDDDRAGARLVVDHLVSLGHRAIIHTSHPDLGLRRPFVLSHTVRCEGYVAAMRERGLPAQVIETSYSEAGGYEAARGALDQLAAPTAIFAGADIAALGVLRAAEERGLVVPWDLSVAGYDNIYASTIGRVSLTTVDQSAQLTGSIAARLVLERIEGRTAPTHHVITPQLLVRATTAVPSSPTELPTRASRSRAHMEPPERSIERSA
jgi:LacI family transcriptional regulator